MKNSPEKTIDLLLSRVRALEAELMISNDKIITLNKEIERPLYIVARKFGGWLRKIPGAVTLLRFAYEKTRARKGRFNLARTVGIDLVSNYISALSSSNCSIYKNAENYYSETNPVVSIIILNWNKYSLTAQCLHEIWKNTKGVNYEIVLLDNGSTAPPSEALLGLPRNYRLIRLAKNRLFGEGNNIAAESAKGEYIIFLNNDVFVQDGWLEPLIADITSESVGAVGPMFYYPNGTIQECGSFIDGNGDPKQRGKGAAKTYPQLLQPDDVHYISAACLLMRKDLFLDVGGFSLDFEPAYYEDVDLCFRIRKTGRVIRYQPLSKVVHIENYSHKEIGQVVEKSIILNRRKFLDRHADLIGLDGASRVRDITYNQFTRKDLSDSRTLKRDILSIYTPYQIYPGGGERYIFTLGSVFWKHGYKVILILDEIYSSLRIKHLLHAFSIDPYPVEIVNLSQAMSMQLGTFFCLGNSITPPIPALSSNSYYICQFPFPQKYGEILERQRNIDGYSGYLCYSEYVSGWIKRASEIFNIKIPKIDVVYPPAHLKEKKTNDHPDSRTFKILTVGRFFKGDHCKNQLLLVDAFEKFLNSRIVRKKSDIEISFDIAGAIHPDDNGLDYFSEVVERAKGLRVSFHPNAGSDEIQKLYEDADIYWHGAGIGVDANLNPGSMEHFGIAIVEAMAAGCVPLAFASGGAVEIIENGRSGYLYENIDTLIEFSEKLFKNPLARQEMADCARQQAKKFSDLEFEKTIIHNFIQHKI